MGPYTVLLGTPALDALLALAPEERAEVRRLLGIIGLDPSVDNLHKIIVPRPPAIFTCYVTRHFWIYYYVRGNIVRITSIERATGHIPAPW